MDVAGPSRMPPKVKKSNWSEDNKLQLVYEIEKRKRIIKNKFNNNAGRNDHTLTPLAEAVLAVIGSTSPNLLGIEGGIDTDEASTAPVSVQPTTNDVVGEDRVLRYEVEVDPGVAFLEVPESEETLDYEPPDWPLDEDEAPVEPGAAAALLRREGPPPVAGGPPEAAAAAEGQPAPLGRRGPARSRPVWRPGAPPADSAASTRAADKQFYRDILEQQHENVKKLSFKIAQEEVLAAEAAAQNTHDVRGGEPAVATNVAIRQD
ncbi:uncharacterized protein LOC115322807 [Ixodes scapularis]|uniref:uncharacterized protein LOC115322807 n=1 Tax=Ixodes scapularis TaxID=6945 RepID=UPI001A9E214D|nr:uncharacterized protein LOC115322807 [Ixodes scapularis]